MAPFSVSFGLAILASLLLSVTLAQNCDFRHLATFAPTNPSVLRPGDIASFKFDVHDDAKLKFHDFEVSLWSQKRGPAPVDRTHPAEKVTFDPLSRPLVERVAKIGVVSSMGADYLHGSYATKPWMLSPNFIVDPDANYFLAAYGYRMKYGPSKSGRAMPWKVVYYAVEPIAIQSLAHAQQRKPAVVPGARADIFAIDEKYACAKDTNVVKVHPIYATPGKTTRVTFDVPHTPLVNDTAGAVPFWHMSAALYEVTTPTHGPPNRRLVHTFANVTSVNATVLADRQTFTVDWAAPDTLQNFHHTSNHVAVWGSANIAGPESGPLPWEDVMWGLGRIRFPRQEL
ncbi:hypothetical protein HDU87_006657 [Geranomyces variabilis]|uniref:Uncharacterized protein n=1 Tax=Geranomyces variabilis TaxID=109894 RepID=A0AAD5TEX6_9FUNG|nr:hypothetical protein HDU87_006657 [Geranomyces variabilis]